MSNYDPLVPNYEDLTILFICLKNTLIGEPYNNHLIEKIVWS